MRAEVDMIGMTPPLESPIVHQLFVDESIQAFDWLRADAHVALRPYLSKLVLPRGVADLPRDRPAKDLTLVATKTSLVVRRICILQSSTCSSRRPRRYTERPECSIRRRGSCR